MKASNNRRVNYEQVIACKATREAASRRLSNSKLYKR